MLPIDHVPVAGRSLTALHDAFTRLGFTVSPTGAYRSADFPQAVWPACAVFLQAGWFDLQPAASDRPPGPFGCLFRADDLDESLRDFADLRTRPPYRLERRWDVDIGLPPAAFRLFELRERVAPLGLAVIEHGNPRADVRPGWLEHANGAIALTGITFAGAAPGPAADRVAGPLDVSVFDYPASEDFDDRFGDAATTVAVRVRVGSVDVAAQVLEGNGVRFRRHGSSLCVDAVAATGCAFDLHV